MTLVDTSSWVEALRAGGRVDVRERVREVILAGEAVWCDFVRLELWNGARGEYEKRKLAELEREIPCLPIGDEVWALSVDLAKKCRKAGKTVPASDLLIASCSIHHGASLEHCDLHFDIIQKIHAGKS